MQGFLVAGEAGVLAEETQGVCVCIPRPFQHVRYAMSMRSRGWSSGAFALVILCAFANGAPAQIATATLAGSVRDETGAALPGVTLSVKSATTGATRSATTDSEGRYRIAALEPGEYEIRAELQNFKATVRTGVVLTVGGTAETDLTMSLGSVTEVVTVRSEAPLIEPD